jgi:hypothetical protein
MRFRVFFTDNFVHDPRSYLAPAKATAADIERYIRQFNRHGYSAWVENEPV